MTRPAKSRAGIDRTGTSVARAHAVQGLVCAHGFQDTDRHLALVPNVFVSLAALTVIARFSFTGSNRAGTRFLENGRSAPAAWRERGLAFVKRLLDDAGAKDAFEVDIQQDFPSGVGLGSSAAVYAALTLAVTRAVHSDVTSRSLSATARLGSYSAAAAITGHVSVVRSTGSHKSSYAEVICPSDRFPFDVLVLAVRGDKRSAEIHEDIVHSPYFEAWLPRARRLSASVVQAIRKRRFDEIGSAVESYIYENLGVVMAGSRHIMAWRPGTLRRLEFLRQLRVQSNIPFFLAMNSGPGLFVYAEPSDAGGLAERIRQAGFACIHSRVGGGALTDGNVEQGGSRQ
jgi:phosphomevalonate decarboxylase